MKHMVTLVLLGCPGILSPRGWIPATHPWIQYAGRWERVGQTAMAHSWPGVYLTFHFIGDSIWVRMDDPINFYNVEVDGKPVRILHGDHPGETDYLLAEGLGPGPHILRLSKRNSAFGRIFTLSGFWLSKGGVFLPPPEKPPLRIEFLGDSYTCAEGNEATEAEMEWTATMPVTNLDRGFPAMVARHFGAEYQVTARPGIGLVCDWQGNRDIALPQWFDRALMEFETPKWRFTRFIPHWVVICLGLNDYSGFGGWKGPVSEEDAATFRKTYHDFIATLREVYPGVRILAVAPHVPWIQQQVKAVVEKENGQGKQDIRYTWFDSVEGGYVANGHPTVSTHQIIASRIIQAMENWGKGE